MSTSNGIFPLYPYKKGALTLASECLPLPLTSHNTLLNALHRMTAAEDVENQ